MGWPQGPAGAWAPVATLGAMIALLTSVSPQSGHAMSWAADFSSYSVLEVKPLLEDVAFGALNVVDDHFPSLFVISTPQMRVLIVS